MLPTTILLALLGSLPLSGELPHAVRDELPAEFGRETPYGLGSALPALDWTKAQLGRALFFDARLSDGAEVSCASCHLPQHGFADDRALSIGVHGRRTVRNAPSLVNRGLGKSFFWDGRAATLEEQVLQPIENPDEMGTSVESVLARLAQDRALVARFGGTPTRENLASALAEFVRSVRLGESPVDRFQGGDFSALSASERLGLWVYESKGKCWQCHSGVNFSDEDFHNTGVGAREGVAELGRMQVTQRAEDRGRFKTPTLRGIAHSAPYMHDGSLATLADVVAFYRKGGGANPDRAPVLGEIEISDEDASNLVAFLEALSRRAEPRPAAK